MFDVLGSLRWFLDVVCAFLACAPGDRIDAWGDADGAWAVGDDGCEYFNGGDVYFDEVSWDAEVDDFSE